MKFYVLIFSIFLVLLIDAQAQNHKYELWKIPSFFRGFNVLPSATHQLKDYRDLKATGANLAQLGIDGLYFVDPPYEVNVDAITATDKMVGFCDSAGIYYILTVRSGPGRRDVYQEKEGGAPKSTIWKNKDEQKKYAQMLRDIVRRFGKDTLFVGIGLMVEPNPLFDQLNINAKALKTSLEKESIDFKAINQLFIEEVRKADANIPIIVQNFQYSCPEFFAITDTFTDEYIVYEFHSYRPIGYASNDKPNTVTYPGKFISINDLKQIDFDKNVLKTNVFKFIDSVQKETDKPFFLGEFGIMYEQGGGTLFLNDMYEICMEEGWHFALWVFRGGGNGGFDFESKSPIYWETVLNMFKYSGIDDDYESDEDCIKIYPNPADDYLYLKSSEKYFPERIEIYSMLGNKLKSMIFENQENRKIFVGDLPVGLYFVKKGMQSVKLFLIH
ncbi:MAG: cellulase family glycosylhydrolase [Bacteroidetes bacterium]|nr:cellulase family glycosylhydrolase [Bacteroidota bacterium]